MLEGPFGAARFLFALPLGQWISAGAITGVHPVVIGDRVAAIFHDRMMVDC